MARPGIFISYRRDDTAGHVGRLYDALTSKFGTRRVFMDIDHIAPGDDFVRALESAITKSAVVLVVIGRRWTGVDSVHARIMRDGDFVRLEVAAALRRGGHVIPVLVQGAEMPDASQLPADLHDLLTRNAFELSDLRWRDDVRRLVRELERIVAGIDRAADAEERAPIHPWRWGIAAALVLAIVGAAYARGRMVRPATAMMMPTAVDSIAPPVLPDDVVMKTANALDDAHRWRPDARLVMVDVKDVLAPPGHTPPRAYITTYTFVAQRDGQVLIAMDGPEGRVYDRGGGQYLPEEPVRIPFMELGDAIAIAQRAGMRGNPGRALLEWHEPQGRPARLVWTLFPGAQSQSQEIYNVDTRTRSVIPTTELMD